MSSAVQLITFVLLFSEAQTKCEAICCEACGAAEARTEEECPGALCCSCGQAFEQHLDRDSSRDSMHRQSGAATILNVCRICERMIHSIQTENFTFQF